MNEASDYIRINNGLLRYYMHVQDPDALDDEEWAGLVRMLEWIRKKEAGKQ